MLPLDVLISPVEDFESFLDSLDVFSVVEVFLAKREHCTVQPSTVQVNPLCVSEANESEFTAKAQEWPSKTGELF